MNIRLGVLIAIIWLCATPIIAATTYQVSSHAEVVAALAIAVAGDTIEFADGTYKDTRTTNWHYAYNPANSGTEGLPITLRAANRGGAIIQKNSRGIPSIGIYERNYITIDGFTIEGGIQYHSCTHGIVKNCEITQGFEQTYDIDIGGSEDDCSLLWGINIQDTSHTLIQNNYIHSMVQHFVGIPPHNAAGIMVFTDSDNNIIEYNTVDGETTEGTSAYWVGCAYGTKGGLMDDNIWRYNFGINTSSCGFMIMGSTGGGDLTYRGKIHNNIIVNSPRFLESFKGGNDWEIYNNTAVFRIGRNSLTGTALPYDGLIYEVIVFNRHITEAEALEIHQNGINGSKGAY